MVDFVNTVDVLGDDAVIDSIIEKNITEFKDDTVTTIGKYVFFKCTSLATLDLPSVTSIGSVGCFEECTTLKALILRGSKLCVLLGSGAFNGTPIKSGTGYIYVPRALLSDTDETKDYRRATNWSTYAAQFRALEDFTVDGTVDGELDETKIAA